MSIARLDGDITESHGETRWQHLHLHLQLRSGRLRNGKRVGARGNLHRLRNGGDFGFLERIPENRRKGVDSTPTNTAHTAQYSLFTSAERIARAWLKSHELQCHLCAPDKGLSSGQHMSHPLLLTHLPHTTITSSSSFTLPSTTTPEHALQSGQHDLLQEHPVHHQPLQAIPVEKHRYQEPLWQENLQSEGNLRNTFSTILEDSLGAGIILALASAGTLSSSSGYLQQLVARLRQCA